MQQDRKASSSEQELLIGPYRVLKTLGTGNFATSTQRCKLL